MSDEPTFDARPTSARWTHLALRVADIDSTIEWYTSMTPLVLIERRQDDAGFVASGMPSQAPKPASS